MLSVDAKIILDLYNKLSIKQIAEKTNKSIIEIVRILRDHYIIDGEMARNIVKDELILAAANVHP